MLISIFVMGAERHMAAVGFVVKPGVEVSLGKSPRCHTHGIASPTRPSPSALNVLGPNVTARLVLTLSEATDLIEARCQR